MLFPAQIRAARAMLNISQTELSARSGVGVATIKRIEKGRGLSGSARTLVKIQNALEEGGVEFLWQTKTTGPGVRLAELQKSA